MDWYYPMLSGALEGEPARAPDGRVAGTTFVMEGLGVRCVSTSDWVTAAETAECVLALDAARDGRAAARTCSPGPRACAGRRRLLLDRMVYPDRVTFPDAERTTYTAAAIILAADALSDTTPAAGLFRGECLPASTWPSRLPGRRRLHRPAAAPDPSAA